jgi:hypothetical protein
VRAVARFFDSLTEPVHIAAWADDLIFVMSMSEHGECVGFDGGCPVCVEYHGLAIKVQGIIGFGSPRRAG